MAIYAQLLLLLGVKAPPEGFGGGTHSTFLEHFTALDIQKAQITLNLLGVTAVAADGRKALRNLALVLDPPEKRGERC